MRAQGWIPKYPDINRQWRDIFLSPVAGEPGVVELWYQAEDFKWYPTRFRQRVVAEPPKPDKQE